MNKPIAIVGPEVAAIIDVIAKSNCRHTLDIQVDHVRRFARRARELAGPRDLAIVLINVDEAAGLGAHLADVLMPGLNWQCYRDRGEIPFARGLVARPGMQEMLDEIHPDVAKRMRKIEGYPVLVVDHGTVDVFTTQDAS